MSIRIHGSAALLAWSAAIALAVTACSKSSSSGAGGDTEASGAADTEDRAGEEAASASDEGAQPADQAQPLAAVMPAYEKVRVHLFEDAGGEVPAAAGELERAARSASESAPTSAAARLETIADRAAEMAKASGDDLAALRASFAGASEALVAMVEASPQRGGYHLFECPMAEDYGRWVQTDGTLANPYMGQEMPTCGKEIAMAGGDDHAHEGGDDHAHEGGDDHAHEGGDGHAHD